MAAGKQSDAEPTPRDEERLREACEKSLARVPSSIERIPAGLGTRRFYRIAFDAGAPSHLIARLEAEFASLPGNAPKLASGDTEAEPEPPPWLPEPALEPLRSFLEDAGLPVPASALHDEAAGLDLLEDVGDTTLLDVAKSERLERYREACDLIPRLQSLDADPEQVPAFARTYDRALVDSKAWKWLHWTIPLLLDRPASPSEIRETTALFEHIHDLAAAAPMALSHRDFKAENLHLTTSRFSSADPALTSPRLVMIDVQGAFLAPPEYDLVCLLCDMQVELDPEEISRLAEETRPRLPAAPSRAVFEERFDALTLARVCKDVSHVIHASLRRGDRRRWKEIPRAFDLLSEAAERRQNSFPGARALTSVIQTLTRAVESADSQGLGPRKNPGQTAGDSVGKRADAQSGEKTAR